MSIRPILLCLLMLAVAVPAAAQRQSSERAGAFQISLQTRYTPSTDVEGDNGTGVEIEDDMGWGFGMSFNFTPKLNLGVGFNWRTVPYTATIIDVDDPDVSERILSEFDVGAMELRGSYFFLDKVLTPYVNGSWGILFVDSNIQASTSTGCWYWPYWGIVCTDYSQNYGVTTWSAGLGGGVRWEPGSEGNLFINLGYEYGWTGSDLLDNAHIVKLEFGLLL